MFSRKKAVQLKLKVKPTKKQYISHGGYGEYDRYQFIISLVNEGKNIAKYPYVGISLSNGGVEQFGIDGNGGRGLSMVKNNDSFDYHYIGGTDKVIHPNVVLDIDKFSVEIKQGEIVPDVEIDYFICAENMESLKGKIKIESSILDSLKY